MRPITLKAISHKKMAFLLGSREIIIIPKYLENLCLIKSSES